MSNCYTKIILPLADGGVTSVQYDCSCDGGCEPCDYGSQYIDYLTVELTKMKIVVSTNTMYEHALCTADLIQMFLGADKAMTEEQFLVWMYEKIIGMIKDKRLTRGGWRSDGKSTYKIVRGADIAVTDIDVYMEGS